MNLGFWYDARRVRGRFGSLFGVVLVLGLVAGAVGDVPKKDLPAGGRGLGTSTVALQTTVAVNRVIMALTDRGGVGAIPGSVAGGGFWRATTDQYIFASGVNVGATVAEPGGGLDTLIMLGGPFTQLRPGGVVPFQTRSGATLPGGDLGVFWRATDPEDFANFPLPCTVDEFRIGLFPTLAPFRGLPFPGFADETVCWAVNDVDGAPCSSCGGARLGGEIQLTAFAFSVPAVQDYFFVIFRVINRSEFVTPTTTPGNSAFGPYDFMDTVVAIAIDPDLGDATDDQIGFLPAPINTMVWWDSDFSEPDFQFQPPGFGGVSYLKTPEDPDTGEEVGLQSFTVFTNSTTRPDPSSRQEWYQGMTGDPNFVVFDVPADDVRGMASSGQFPLPAGEFVEIYAAYFFAEAFGALPGELLTQNAIVNGEPIAVFNNFVAAQAGVQAVFDAGFLVPTAPPSPNVELIPGDHQVTVVWDASTIASVNTFAKVARDPFLRDDAGNPDPNAPGLGIFLTADQIVFDPASDVPGTTAAFVTAAEAGVTGQEVTNPFFDPDFVIQDFEGFRVYRSFTGNTDDAVLIAQFDLNNDIVEGDFCVSGQAVTDPDTGELVEAVCTGSEFLAIGMNTGLLFGVTDRGGTFPNPADGPGLINGIPVYYAVTSFGVNCGVLTVSGIDESFIPELDPPAACLTLESGKNLMPATPRSNASSFVDAGVGGAQLISNTTGTVLVEPGAGADLPLDADGNLTGPIPPAQAWSATLQVLQPTEIPEDFEVRIVIDSIPVAFEWFGTVDVDFTGGPGFDQTPAGDPRGRQIFFHVEDGTGTRLNTPSGPAEGSFFTGFIPFGPGGSITVTSPQVSILSPTNPSAGAVAIVQWSTSVGERISHTVRAGLALLEDAIGSGTPPSSVANHDWEVGLYGAVNYGDFRLTWGRAADGSLTLTEVFDLSHDVPVEFNPDVGFEGWGFAAPVTLGPEEQELADLVEGGGDLLPTTPDGRYPFPTPIFEAFGGQNTSFTLVQQAGPDWANLPVNPDIFDLLAPHASSWTGKFPQRGSLTRNSAVYNCPASGGSFGCDGAGAGKQMTRLWLKTSWLQVAFDQLPADGEQWFVRLANSAANAPRMPPPNTAIRFNVSGGTNVLANADLQEIKVVPNPFIAANEITRGRGRQRVLFTNLPPQATIRIYTISGNLVRILEHGNGSGTTEWDVRTRFDLLVASGNYYYHVTTPDGRTHLGRFAVIN
jgi:hypothetical protein